MKTPCETDLVLRVNEIYHDLENREYTEIHPEIFNQERDRWQSVTEHLPLARESISLLDIGCGTGFVAQQIGPFLKPDDRIVCADISTEMLQVCKESLSSSQLQCQVNYSKLDGKVLPYENEQFDIVTMNSTLHHIPEIPEFLTEVNRILKPQGHIIVGHEPNSAHYQAVSLRIRRQVLGMILCPRRTMGNVLRAIGLINLARLALKPISRRFQKHNRLLDDLNERIVQEGLVDKPLKWDQITALVDIHSPTAGGIDKQRGFSAESLARDYLNGYEIVHVETYNHLDDISHANRLTKHVDSRLNRKYPTLGATFMAVYQKEHELN